MRLEWPPVRVTDSLGAGLVYMSRQPLAISRQVQGRTAIEPARLTAHTLIIRERCPVPQSGLRGNPVSAKGRTPAAPQNCCGVGAGLKPAHACAAAVGAGFKPARAAPLTFAIVGAGLKPARAGSLELQIGQQEAQLARIVGVGADLAGCDGGGAAVEGDLVFARGQGNRAQVIALEIGPQGAAAHRVAVHGDIQCGLAAIGLRGEAQGPGQRCLGDDMDARHPGRCSSARCA